MNDKRIQRLWRDEGLKVPYRKRKKPLRGIGVAVGAMCPIRPNAIWALDFQFDTTSDGRTLKICAFSRPSQRARQVALMVSYNRASCEVGC